MWNVAIHTNDCGLSTFLSHSILSAQFLYVVIENVKGSIIFFYILMFLALHK